MQNFKLDQFLLKLKVLFWFKSNFLLIIFLKNLNLVDSLFVKVPQWRLIFLFYLLNLFLDFIDTVFNVINNTIFLYLKFVEIFNVASFSIFWQDFKLSGETANDFGKFLFFLSVLDDLFFIHENDICQKVINNSAQTRIGLFDELII